MGLGIEERYDEFLKACQANDLELVEDLIFDRKFRLDVNRPRWNKCNNYCCSGR